MPRNILEVINAISDDKTFTPFQNLTQIGRIAKGFAPMLTEILEDYIQQNTGGPMYRIERIRAAKRMLGAEWQRIKADLGGNWGSIGVSRNKSE
jgi:hypothetical protein